MVLVPQWFPFGVGTVGVAVFELIAHSPTLAPFPQKDACCILTDKHRKSCMCKRNTNE